VRRKDHLPSNNRLEISSSRRSALLRFQRATDISFHDITLLDIALTHSSSVNEKSPYIQDNERLEFLGDSVLNLCISHILYESLPDNDEGELAHMKNVLVSETSLASIAISLGIGEFLILGKGEEMSGGRRKPAILADATEALLGAYYLDSGIQSTKEIVSRIFSSKIDELRKTPSKDFKSIIQEYAQKRGLEIPSYRVARIEGPDHARHFFVSCVIDGETFGPMEGMSKKEAEQRVAQHIFEVLHKRDAETARLLDIVTKGSTEIDEKI
jgi:ribonuclease-3